MGKEKEGRLLRMLDETEKRFAAAGIDASDAEWIYCRVLKISRSRLSRDEVISEDEAKRIKAFEDERMSGRPLWYVFGDADFCGCTFFVDERVLIPRPETELLADAVASAARDGDKILDLCTGSGCIAAAVAKGCKMRGLDVSVTASDISEDALNVARENARRNEVSVEFVSSDLFSNIEGRFDIVVCNPPYVPSGEIESLDREVRDFEPMIALDGGKDGMDFYRRIARDIGEHVEEGGRLFLECGENQAKNICDMFETANEAKTERDFAGEERFVKLTFKAK